MEDYVKVGNDEYYTLERAVGSAYEYMLAIDESNASKNLSDEVRLSPLTELLKEAAGVLHIV